METVENKAGTMEDLGIDVYLYLVFDLNHLSLIAEEPKEIVLRRPQQNAEGLRHASIRKMSSITKYYRFCRIIGLWPRENIFLLFAIHCQGLRKDHKNFVQN